MSTQNNEDSAAKSIIQEYFVAGIAGDVDGLRTLQRLMRVGRLPVRHSIQNKN